MTSAGMAYVAGHGIPPSVTANVRAAAAAFFALPAPAKAAYTNAGGYGSGSGDGYTPLGGEAVSASTVGGGDVSVPGGVPRGRGSGGGGSGGGGGSAPPPDVVESLVYTGDPSALPPALVAPVTAYVAAITTALAALMRLSAVALGLPEAALDVWAAGDTSLRLAHYPGSLARVRRCPTTADGGGNGNGGVDREDGCDGSVGDGDRGDTDADADGHLAVGMRYGAHTDYVGFTLLDQQPGVDGLQRLAARGELGGGGEDVPPPAGGALTVNAGDLITLLSGGRWVSPLHRVRVPRRLSRAPPPAGDDAVEGEVAAARGAGGVPARLSLVFFTGPPAATVVRPVVGAAAASGGGKVVAGEWLAAKLRRTNLVGGGGAAADAAP